MSDNFNISFGEETIFGADGKSAYQIACEHGFVGTVDEWLTSLKGNTPDITAYATIDGTIGNPGVEVEEAGTIDNPELTFKFSGLKGKKGDTGATPVITAGGSVNQTVGTPSVEISKTGTAENPHFNFAFSGIKGQQGIKGDTGATPNITANATIDATVGTPSVDVSKSGTNENPVLSFAFHNLKGEKGDDGLDGFASRLTEAEYTADDYFVIDNGTTARKENINDFIYSLDIMGERNYFSQDSEFNQSGIKIKIHGGEINISGNDAIEELWITLEMHLLPKGLYRAEIDMPVVEDGVCSFITFCNTEPSTAGRQYIGEFTKGSYSIAADGNTYYFLMLHTKNLQGEFDLNGKFECIMQADENNILTNTALSIIAENGGINTIALPLEKTKVINGITFAVNKDGDVNINGTATTYAYMDFPIFIGDDDEYILTYDHKDNTDFGGIAIMESPLDRDDWSQKAMVNYQNVTKQGVLLDSEHRYKIRVFVVGNRTADNYVVRPVLCKQNIIRVARTMPCFLGARQLTYKTTLIEQRLAELEAAIISLGGNI